MLFWAGFICHLISEIRLVDLSVDVVCYCLCDLFNQKFSICINIFVIKDWTLKMRCGSSNLLLNHLQQIGLHCPQFLQLTLKCILIGTHRTLKLHHKIILFFFGGIHFFRIHFQLFKKNLIRFVRYCLVELPDNQIIFLNIYLKIHNFLFKFCYFRYNFRV